MQTATSNTVSLRSVDHDNIDVVVRLEISASQREARGPNFNPAYSISRTVIRWPNGEHFDYLPRAIYDGEVVVGYLLLALNKSTPDDQWISDLMIDHRFQRRGIGRAALLLAIEWLKTNVGATRIRMLCEPDNVPAKNLYESLGFKNFASTTKIFSLRLKPLLTIESLPSA